MVIITADDFGKTRHATDSIMTCFSRGRITAASAMVFMEDSERAAGMAIQSNLEIGLHINFTTPFSAPNVSKKITDHHEKIISYLTRKKLSQVIFNPFLDSSFRYLFQSQKEEFVRLYGRSPDFYNGHHHMHLCANMLLGRLIPAGEHVRGTFTFGRGEKSAVNRLYRYMLDRYISSRFISTDCFYSILPIIDEKRHQHILDRSRSGCVEIEVHPENAEELQFLLSERFQNLLNQVPLGTFQNLQRQSA
jgi:predicted glycoside hydrolase/deacetylase ChbG (UPF0249 family)